MNQQQCQVSTYKCGYHRACQGLHNKNKRKKQGILEYRPQARFVELLNMALINNRSENTSQNSYHKVHSKSDV